MNNSAQNRCAVCDEERKIARREFSPHAWTALTVWGEVQSAQSGQAMCNSCYSDFRDLLIERSNEVELYAANSLSDLAAVHDLAGYRANENGAKSQIAS
ncbi:MAG: hypothetical protein EOP07_06635 [Proteobacteria bacterium]|nr:MAG: hypothetical protein EOP07_06635 [Pseudomonadota bacterium]